MGYRDAMGTSGQLEQPRAKDRGELARLAEEQAALRRVATLVAEGAPPAEVFEATGRAFRPTRSVPGGRGRYRAAPRQRLPSRMPMTPAAGRGHGGTRRRLTTPLQKYGNVRSGLAKGWFLR